MSRPLSAVLCGWLILTGLAVAAEEQIVFSQSANGSRNTRPFTVQDGWLVKWDNKGAMLHVSIHTSDGKIAAGGGLATAPGIGESFQPKGGTYYLDISGAGGWTITVVQLP